VNLKILSLQSNRILKIEGLQNCEFLKKLDLTVNFIDFEQLEAILFHCGICDPGDGR